MKFFILSLIPIFLFLTSCAQMETKPIDNKWVKDKWIGEFVDGWDQMVGYLNQFSDESHVLKGKKYNLRVKLDGEWQLFVFPVQAFNVKRVGDKNLFEAEIIDPGALFETSGGISRLTFIQAELKKIGGDQGTIELRPEIDCLFKIKFNQKNGKSVDFDRLQERYEYEFVITPSNEVEVYAITSEYVTLKRVGKKSENAFLRLLLVDKKNKETFYSNQVDVPECGYDELASEPSAQKIMYLQDAGQCVKHLQSHGSRLDETKVDKVFHKEDFFNMCPYPLKCQMNVKYGYVKNKKIVDADTKVYNFSLGPYVMQSIDTSWHYINQQFEFDAKIYIAATSSKSSYPKDYQDNDMPGFLECKFE